MIRVNGNTILERDDVGEFPPGETMTTLKRSINKACNVFFKSRGLPVTLNLKMLIARDKNNEYRRKRSK